MNRSGKKVLVLGNYRQSLTVIRSLGRAGYEVIAGRPGERSFTDYSRYTTDTWQHPGLEGNEPEFIDALNGFLADRDFEPVVFPIGDSQIRCIAENLERFSEPAAVAMPPPTTVLTCQSKSAIYAINQRLGIPQPQFENAHDYAELRSIAERLGYPVVIKPDNSRTPFFGQKVIIASSPDEMSQAMPAWPEGHRHLVVQTYVEGQRHTGHFLADEGDILAYFDYRIIRTDRPDDTGYLVEGAASAPRAKLEEYTRVLARGLRYSGVGSVQFLVDATRDNVSFLEINPRLGATCALPYHCGYDFPRMAVELVEYQTGRRSDRPGNTAPYPDGKRMVWTTGDLRALVRDVRSGSAGPLETLAALLRTTSALLRADFHAAWWWRDPLPVLLPYWNSLQARLTRARRRAR